MELLVGVRGELVLEPLAPTHTSDLLWGTGSLGPLDSFPDLPRLGRMLSTQLPVA